MKRGERRRDAERGEQLEMLAGARCGTGRTRTTRPLRTRRVVALRQRVRRASSAASAAQRKHREQREVVGGDRARAEPLQRRSRAGSRRGDDRRTRSCRSRDRRRSRPTIAESAAACARSTRESWLLSSGSREIVRDHAMSSCQMSGYVMTHGQRRVRQRRRSSKRDNAGHAADVRRPHEVACYSRTIPPGVSPPIRD